MGRVLTFAELMLKEARRDRLYVGILIFAVLFILLALVLGLSPWGHVEEVMLHLGFAGLSLFVLLLGTFMSVNSVARDLQSRVVYTIFSRPVKRWEFITGKYLGVAFYIFMISVIGSLIIIVFTYALGYSGKFRVEAFLITWRIFVETVTTCSYAFLFVTFTSPALAIILSFLIHFINGNSGVLVELAKKSDVSLIKGLVKAVYTIFPDYSYLYVDEMVVHFQKAPFHDILTGTLICAVFSALMIALACIIFSRKEL